MTPRFNRIRFAVDIQLANFTDTARIAYCQHDIRCANLGVTAEIIIELLAVKRGIKRDSCAPNLPLVNADMSWLNGLFSHNTQVFRQIVANEAALFFNLFIVFHNGCQLGYGNGNERAGNGLRATGTLAQRLLNIIPITTTLIN
ncbi:hypothetical protein D3C75_783540 [compost metagenome]